MSSSILAVNGMRMVKGVYMEMCNCVIAIERMGVMMYSKNMVVQGVYMAVRGVMLGVMDLRVFLE